MTEAMDLKICADDKSTGWTQKGCVLPQPWCPAGARACCGRPGTPGEGPGENSIRAPMFADTTGEGPLHCVVCCSHIW